MLRKTSIFFDTSDRYDIIQLKESLEVYPEEQEGMEEKATHLTSVLKIHEALKGGSIPF